MSLLTNGAFCFTVNGSSGGGSIAGVEAMESPSGAINGVNQNFSTTFPYHNLKVFINGVLLTLGSDYVSTGANTFQTVIAPVAGDVLRVIYFKP